MSIHLARVYTESEVRTQVRHAVRAMGHAQYRAAIAPDATARAEALATHNRLSNLAYEWTGILTQILRRNAERSGHSNVVVPFARRGA